MAFVAPYAQRISKAIMDRVHQARYPLVDHPDGVYTVLDACYDGTLSARTGPMSSGWGPSRDKLALLLDREEWQWLLQVGFDTEVNVEALEASFAENPPVLERTQEHDRQVTLFLESVKYDLPVQNAPSRGLKASFRINARMTPA